VISTFGRPRASPPGQADVSVWRTVFGESLRDLRGPRRQRVGRHERRPRPVREYNVSRSSRRKQGLSTRWPGASCDGGWKIWVATANGSTAGTTGRITTYGKSPREPTTGELPCAPRTAPGRWVDNRGRPGRRSRRVVYFEGGRFIASRAYRAKCRGLRSGWLWKHVGQSPRRGPLLPSGGRRR